MKRYEFLDLASKPEIITPSQYYDSKRGDGTILQTRRLMLAILQDGIRCFQRTAGATRKRDKRLFEEAEAWLFDENCEEPFSFNSICDALGIAPQYLRSGLRRWHIRYMAGRVTSQRIGRRLPVMLDGQIKMGTRTPKSKRVSKAR